MGTQRSRGSRAEVAAEKCRVVGHSAPPAWFRRLQKVSRVEDGGGVFEVAPHVQSADSGVPRRTAATRNEVGDGHLFQCEGLHGKVAHPLVGQADWREKDEDPKDPHVEATCHVKASGRGHIRVISAGSAVVGEERAIVMPVAPHPPSALAHERMHAAPVAAKNITRGRGSPRPCACGRSPG